MLDSVVQNQYSQFDEMCVLMRSKKRIRLPRHPTGYVRFDAERAVTQACSEEESALEGSSTVKYWLHGGIFQSHSQRKEREKKIMRREEGGRGEVV